MKTKLIYVGRRFDDGKILYCFLDGKTERFWLKARLVSIGSVYEATRKGKNVTLDVLNPKLIGESNLTEGDIAKYEGLDAGAEAMVRRARAQRKAEKIAKEIVRECWPLVRAVRKMHFSQKRAFVDAIIDEIEGTGKRISK